MDDIKQPSGWAAWTGRLLTTLPCLCKICKQPANALLCTRCVQSLYHPEAYCEQCAEALPAPLLLTQAPALNRCGRCLSTPPAFQRTLFAYAYCGPVAELIQQFKFNETLILSQLLADMIVSRIKNTDFPLPDVLIPVPLHQDRLKQRGFNQSLELARHVGKALEIPVNNSLLLRTRATPKQSGLNRKAREKNIRGAFKVKTRNASALMNGKHLALIDDVITTGSTTREAARVLQRAGATQISVIAVAKTFHGVRLD
jgi:ComF family protein